MRITYLVEDASRIWGGVKAVFDAANALQASGHEVTVVSRSGPPTWTELRCGFRQVAAFTPADVPPSDVVVATYWTTVEPAIAARGAGVAVHYCQGYEGDNPECAPHRERIEAVYRRRETQLVTISPHLARLLRDKFGRDARQVTYAIDHTTLRPGPDRPRSQPLRVGLVGPYEIAWKDIRTGIEACRLARRAGLDLVLVRVTNTGRHPDEAALDIPVEWHECVPPRAMGDLYRSFDVFLGTSRGAEEGFFLPAVEAMACGVPCVLTEIPCYRGYAAGDTQYALFVEPGSPQQMAEALVLAAGHPGLRTELRENGLRTAARYRLEDHVRDLERVFGELVGDSRPAVSPQSAQPASADAVSDRIARTARQAASGCVTVDQLDALQARLSAALGAEVEHRRGLLAYAAGDYETARRAFVAALAGAIAPAEVYNDLGVACFALGAHDEARRAFEAALEIEPAHADARANLADIGVRI